jgi:hypothetical protein
MNSVPSSQRLRPVCFMVMPFGTKDSGINDRSAPGEINFDVLWRKAFRPALERLGFTAIRADQDSGALIVQQMLERLTLADLVVADVTIPNGNVYYEVGVRHAARPTGCVLTAAEWSRPLFDVAQMRRITYRLPSGNPTDKQAKAIREALAKALPEALAARTPPYCLDGFPHLHHECTTSFELFVEQRSRFQAAVVAAASATGTERVRRVRDLLRGYTKQHGKHGPIVSSVALELLYLARDYLAWQETIEFVECLPRSIRNLPEVQEQHCLALSNTGKHLDSLGALEQLIARHGSSSEREGLIGRVYKNLYQETQNQVDKRRYLSNAIEHYERGMLLDLNDFYPSSNLPRLLRHRGGPGDAERARTIARLVAIACERALEQDPRDPWGKLTLLGAAFEVEDVKRARELVARILDDGPVDWRIGTTVKDLKLSVAMVQDARVKRQLTQLIKQLEQLAAGSR